MGFALKLFRNTWVQHLLLSCSLIRQHVCSKHSTACEGRGAHMGSPYIFAITPTTPQFLVKKKKMKTKL